MCAHLADATKTVELQTVINAAKKSIESHSNPPAYKLAHLMLTTMNGDPNVIPEILKPSGNPMLSQQTDDPDLIASTSESSIIESKGLLGLTKENIIDIKTYVKKSLTLRTTEAEVATVLGYTKDSPISKDHPELSPCNFASFYKQFNDHAKLWSGLEASIVAQGNALQTYGTTFVSHSAFVLENIKAMKIFTTTVEEAFLTDPEDLDVQSGLVAILERWKDETNKYQASTAALLASLTDFQNTLVNDLQPSANSMFNVLSRLDIAEETKKLQEEMNTMQMQIEALQKKYDKDCALAFTGVLGLLLGPLVVVTWAVTGGAFGSSAETTRKSRNEMQAKLKEKQELYNNLNQVSGNVYEATSGIADLQIAVTNAITGLQMLNGVWDLLTQYITSASESLNSIKCKSKLSLFAFEIESAQSTWSNVPEIAAGLLDLFKQADMSFKLSNALCEVHAERILASSTVALPDTDEWNDKYAVLNSIIIEPNSAFMPTLQQKAHELRADARAIYSTVGQALPNAILVKGQAAQRASERGLLDRLAQRVKEAPSDQDALEEYNERIGRFLKTASEFDSKLASLEKEIRDNSSILKKNTRADLTATGFYAQLNTECKRFERVIQSHTRTIIQNFITPMLALEDKMKVLDAEIDKKIDPENILKTFKEFLPSEQEVSDMLTTGAASAEAVAVEQIKLIYSTMLKGIDIIGSAIKLCKQIDERSRLANELQALQAGYAAAEQDRKAMLIDQMELQQLLRLHGTLAFFAESGAAQAQEIRTNRENLLLNTSTSPANYSEYNQYLSNWINLYNT